MTPKVRPGKCAYCKGVAVRNFCSSSCYENHHMGKIFVPPQMFKEVVKPSPRQIPCCDCGGIFTPKRSQRCNPCRELRNKAFDKVRLSKRGRQ